MSDHTTTECCGGSACETAEPTTAELTTSEAGPEKSDETASERRAPRRRFRPRVDVLETAEAFRLTADVPGVAEEDVELTVEDDVLTLTATVPDGPVAGRDREALLNRGAGYPEGDWHRTFRLGQTVDRDGVSAELRHGVLTVTLPKAKERLRRTIAVNTAA